jgi:prepilin-type N-terminal cleavage/methylation domain-containing protein
MFRKLVRRFEKTNRAVVFIQRLQTSQRGFSLVEAVITIAVTGIAMAGLFQSTVYSMKLQSSVTSNNEISDEIALLRLYLQDSANCIAALGGGNQKYNNTQLKIYKPSDPNQVFLERGQEKGKWSIKNLSIDGTNAVNPGTWIGSIQLLAEKNGSASVGGSELLRSLPVSFVTDNIGRITDCSSTGDLSLFSNYELGTIDNEGWATYVAANKGTYQTFNFSGSCKVGYIAVSCLSCIGVGCTPNISMYDSNSQALNDYMTTYNESSMIQHFVLIENPTPANPTKAATCTMQKKMFFSTEVPNNDPIYVAHSTDLYYYRTIPICIRP